MQRYQLSPDRAFEFLTRVARIHDITLEVLATQLVDEIAQRHHSQAR